jgi:hypothetical protein
MPTNVEAGVKPVGNVVAVNANPSAATASPAPPKSAVDQKWKSVRTRMLLAVSPGGFRQVETRRSLSKEACDG